jgi:short subunit dehydrogenase-like uncharacterized protein
MEKRWLLYGVNGYTGRLLAERAVAAGARPVVAGRRAEAVRPIAERLGLSWAALSLEDPEALAGALEGIALVMHCAGPFSQTSRPMVDACLRAKVHYLDITGEISVFEEIFARDAEAKARGVALLPGVGCDVVPSDCLAALLHQRLPEASSLELAIHPHGRASPGTTKTAIEGLGKGFGAVRRGGRIVSAGHLTRLVPFPRGERRGLSVSWGDVSTAYHSTGIPDITVYISLPGPVMAAMRATHLVSPLLGLPPVQRLLKGGAEREDAGAVVDRVLGGGERPGRSPGLRCGGDPRWLRLYRRCLPG